MSAFRGRKAGLVSLKSPPRTCEVGFRERKLGVEGGKTRPAARTIFRSLCCTIPFKLLKGVKPGLKEEETRSRRTTFVALLLRRL
jgi:hypothetical protein